MRNGRERWAVYENIGLESALRKCVQNLESGKETIFFHYNMDIEFEAFPLAIVIALV